ncbi:PQQ-binding-like beta-propeller repeat protein [Streptomyces sp. NPDC049967]|uniref:PQQ-binding-like beta-propeller repeat protein n=1 Tax=Streptomyces sp. NPDC049967 TaxID=3155658 RepID=UPI00343A6705
MGPTAVNELGGPDRAGVYPQGAVPDGFQPWRFRCRGGDFDCSPVVCDGTVYVNASRGPCFALDALTGACRWRFTAPGGVCNAPAVMDGLVFVTDWNHGLWALDAVSGRVRWHREGSRYCKNVLAQGGVVYLSDVGYPFKFIRGKGDLVAVDAASGQDLWQTPKSDYGVNTIALSGGRIFHNGGEGELSAYDARSGELLWRDAGGGRQEFGSSCPPSVANRVVYVGSGAVLSAFSRGGRDLWGCRTGGPVLEAPAVRGDTVYVSVERVGVYALNASDGQQRWRLADAQGGSAFAISGPTGWLVTGRDRRYLCAVDLATGKRLWQRDLGGRGRGTTPFLWQGIAFLAAGRDSVIAAEAEQGLMPPRLRPAQRFRGGRSTGLG